MDLPFSLIDAFAEQPLHGNQAGVVELSQPTTSTWMQDLATEFGWSETAFLVRDGDDTWQLRWFTPACEVDLCGHATLAAAAHLSAHQRTTSPRLHFTTARGTLTAVINTDATITLNFPAIVTTPVATAASLPEALGCMPLAVASAGHDLLVELPDADAVRRCQPDMELIASVTTRGMIITAEGDEADLDVVSRFFAPNAGIPEDPVTGSAHCALAPWWAPRLGRQQLTCHQCSPRGGRLTAKLHGDRVLLTGQAWTVISGTLPLAPPAQDSKA